MAYKPPVATVVKSERKGDVVVTVLKFKEAPSPPAAPGTLWVWPETDGPVAAGELHRVVKRRRKKLTFETYHNKIQPLIDGSVYKFFSWWNDCQLAVAHSDPARWEKQEFKPRDAVKFYIHGGGAIARKLEAGEIPPPEAEIMKDGWDHEHCSLCWKTISQYEDYDQVGYTDGTEWLCEACYEQYIVLGFGKKLGEAI